MIDKFYVSIPIIGTIIIKAKLARFSMVMQNLSAAGVNIIEMLDISKMPFYIRLDWLNYNKKEIFLFYV